MVKDRDELVSNSVPILKQCSVQLTSENIIALKVKTGKDQTKEAIVEALNSYLKGGK
jgi:hypothetical protein